MSEGDVLPAPTVTVDERGYVIAEYLMHDDGQGGRVLVSIGAGPVRMEIDPRVSPPEVMEAYRRIRRLVTGGERIRRLSDRHLAMAAYAPEEGETWDDVLDRWNRDHRDRPEWQAADKEIFARDCREARKTLADREARFGS